MPLKPVVSPREILDFWFKDTPEAKWFAVDPALDAEIRRRFLETWQAAREGALRGWQSSAEGAFARIVLLDQFPRNMFRGHAESFATDAQAREAANDAVAHAFDLQAPKAVRNFFYLPFMHSENAADQDRSVALLEERCGADHYSFPFALEHRRIIARFGRFPARNAALGRISTPEELAFLAENRAP
jgi:uncharacterized protein (DUF924 family)